MNDFTPPPFFDLLRHGRTESADIFRGRVEDPLSEVGWRQMESAVSGMQWQEIVSSPLSRCHRFASSLSRQLNVPLHVEERFAEYDFGDWDGKCYQEVMDTDGDLVERFFDDPFTCTPPNAERFSDFHERVTGAWHDRLDASMGKAVLIITHGGVIMSVIADIMGLDRVHGKVDVGYANLTRIRPGTDGMPHRLVSHIAPEEN